MVGSPNAPLMGSHQWDGFSRGLTPLLRFQDPCIPRTLPDNRLGPPGSASGVGSAGRLASARGQCWRRRLLPQGLGQGGALGTQTASALATQKWRLGKWKRRLTPAQPRFFCCWAPWSMGNDDSKPGQERVWANACVPCKINSRLLGWNALLSKTNESFWSVQYITSIPLSQVSGV